MESKRYVIATDLHYPLHSRSAWRVLLEYLRDNPPDGFVFLGDQLDMQEISHWTQGKALYRKRGALANNLDGFAAEVLDPLDAILPAHAERVWLTGNHERFITLDLIEQQPELEGMLDLDDHLRLRERGYKVIGLGGHHQIGKLYAIHGDQIGGGANPAKKAVDTWAQSVVMGHVHTIQQHTKASPAHGSMRWIGTTLPCLCETNPGYGRGRANTWINGFGIVNVRHNGDFNLYPVVIVDGVFTLPDGRTYGKQKRARVSTSVRGITAGNTM